MVLFCKKLLLAQNAFMAVHLGKACCVLPIINQASENNHIANSKDYQYFMKAYIRNEARLSKRKVNFWSGPDDVTLEGIHQAVLCIADTVSRKQVLPKTFKKIKNKQVDATLAHYESVAETITNLYKVQIELE